MLLQCLMQVQAWSQDKKQNFRCIWSKQDAQFDEVSINKYRTRTEHTAIKPPHNSENSMSMRFTEHITALNLENLFSVMNITKLAHRCLYRTISWYIINLYEHKLFPYYTVLTYQQNPQYNALFWQKTHFRKIWMHTERTNTSFPQFLFFNN